MTSNAIRPRDPVLTAERVPKITPKETIKKIIANTKNKTPRVRANSRPTEDSLRQWGQRARLFSNVLNRNDSWQWPQITRHIPGIGAIAGVELLPMVWFAERVIIRLLLSKNHFKSKIIYSSKWIPLLSRTGYSLSTSFTYEKTITGTANVLLAGRSSFYGLSVVIKSLVFK